MLKENSEESKLVNSYFRPKIIRNIEVAFFKEDERGKFYIIANPKNSKYIKVHESIYNLIKMFNGINTITDIERKILEEEIPVDIYDLLKLLAEKGFIENLRFQQKNQENERHSFKIKFLDLSDEFMDKLCQFFSFVKNPFFKIFYILFCAGGLLIFFSNLQSIFSAAIAVWRPETDLMSLLLSIPLFYLVIFSHELSHAAVYHFLGGKSVSMGLEFHFLIPFFYTHTPDTRKMRVRDNITVFSAGPLTSLFFSEVFTYLFLFNKQFANLWAVGSFSFHLGVLFSLCPILRTDGYYIMQSLLKFPNLLQHGISNLKNILNLLTGKISLQEYRDYLAQYSVSERRILTIYTLLLPIVTGILIYFSVVLVLLLGVIDVLVLTPIVFAGRAPYPKVYLLWSIYIVNLAVTLMGVFGTAIHTVWKSGFIGRFIHSGRK